MAVLVTNDFPPDHGGIQRYMSRIAQELIKTGEPIVVVAPISAGSRQFDSLQTYRILRYPNIGRLVGTVAMTLSLLWARLTARRSYIIASMWFPGGAAACLVPKFIRGRLAILAHGTEIAPNRAGLRRRIMRYVFARADVIVANSSFTADLLKQAGVRKSIAIVHPGIDGSEIAPERAATPSILSVGRLVQRKGFDKVIAAMPDVLKKFPTARYEVVGDGPQRDELEALARHLGVSEAVTFRGAIDDEELRKAYARAWLFALPVRAIGDDVEGFGLVYLEAALAGLPAVGGLRSGAQDAIVEGETGLLVEGASQQEVTNALIALLQDPDRARSMGERGRERATREFTWSLSARSIASAMART
jgi:phosphatidylinositol alpha-1,6-mannosyltransferase